jgi:serine/threonine protein kinase
MDSTVDKLEDNNTFNFDKFPIYAKQMITGLYECHRCDLIHRDIKTNNIVYNAADDIFKIIDFGLTVPYASKRKSLYTNLVSTYPYRAPEAFFGLQYNNKVDVWALGCVFYYIMTKKYVVNAIYNDTEALKQIFQLFGTPTEEEWSGITLLLQQKNIPVYPKNNQHLKEIFKQYYDFIMPCFELNPASRADTTQLLTILKNKY